MFRGFNFGNRDAKQQKLLTMCAIHEASPVCDSNRATEKESVHFFMHRLCYCVRLVNNNLKSYKNVAL